MGETATDGQDPRNRAVMLAPNAPHVFEAARKSPDAPNNNRGGVFCSQIDAIGRPVHAPFGTGAEGGLNFLLI